MQSFIMKKSFILFSYLMKIFFSKLLFLIILKYLNFLLTFNWQTDL